MLKLNIPMFPLKWQMIKKIFVTKLKPTAAQSFMSDNLYYNIYSKFESTKSFQAVPDFQADFDFLGVGPPADFSAGLFFKPFIFRVCSLLRSCFCMWIRP